MSQSHPSEWMTWLEDDYRNQPRSFAPDVPLIERVLRRSERVESGCWLYQGSLDSGGYSCLRIGQRNDRGHRITWQAANGEIPEGKHIDHLCRIRSCVNPEHLEPVTVRENTFMRALWVGDLPKQTHCPNGHEMTPENIYHRPDNGSRQCRACIRNRSKKQLVKLREATVRRQQERGNVCRNGHEMTPENTYAVPGTTWKTCVTCRKATSLRRRKK